MPTTMSYSMSVKNSFSRGYYYLNSIWTIIIHTFSLNIHHVFFPKIYSLVRSCFTVFAYMYHSVWIYVIDKTSATDVERPYGRRIVRDIPIIPKLLLDTLSPFSAKMWAYVWYSRDSLGLATYFSVSDICSRFSLFLPIFQHFMVEKIIFLIFCFERMYVVV